MRRDIACGLIVTGIVACGGGPRAAPVAAPATSPSQPASSTSPAPPNSPAFRAAAPAKTILERMDDAWKCHEIETPELRRNCFWQFAYGEDAPNPSDIWPASCAYFYTRCYENAANALGICGQKCVEPQCVPAHCEAQFDASTIGCEDLLERCNKDDKSRDPALLEEEPGPPSGARSGVLAP